MFDLIFGFRIHYLLCKENLISLCFVFMSLVDFSESTKMKSTPVRELVQDGGHRPSWSPSVREEQPP